MNTYQQVFRYGMIGLASNLIIYLLYLLLTSLGLGYKTAMTVTYSMGVAQTFIFNKKWTFRHDDHLTQTAIRYILSYIFVYFINLLALLFFVGHMAWPHQLIQGILILLLAALLFVLQKYWVFKLSNKQR